MARRLAASLIAAFCLLLPSTPAGAFTEGRMPLSQLAERANTIVIGTVGQLLKVYAEQRLGLASWMESIADYPIVSVAHAYGVAAGLIFELARGYKLTRGTAFTIWRRRRID